MLGGLFKTFGSLCGSIFEKVNRSVFMKEQHGFCPSTHTSNSSRQLWTFFILILSAFDKKHILHTFRGTQKYVLPDKLKAIRKITFCWYVYQTRGYFSQLLKMKVTIVPLFTAFLKLQQYWERDMILGQVTAFIVLTLLKFSHRQGWPTITRLLEWDAGCKCPKKKHTWSLMPTTLPLALRPGSCTYQVPSFPPGKAVSARMFSALDHLMKHRCRRPYCLQLLCVTTQVYGNWRLQT